MQPLEIILTADLHLNDNSAEDLAYGEALLNDLGAIAQGRGIPWVVVAGDFFDWKQRHSTRLLTTVYGVLEGWHARGVNFVLLRGNHDSADMMREPEWTVLSLFSRVAIVLTQPVVVEEADAIILFLPWYPPLAYTKLLQEFAKIAIGSGKKRYLISHVSLAEGKVSASNTRVSQPIRIHHLMPELWTGGIFLGDYHMHQYVAEHICYVGSPRPMTFGDEWFGGVWELTAKSFQNISLPTRFPMFATRRVDGLSDLPLMGYDPRDHLRIYCPIHLRQHLATLYPTAKLISEQISTEEGRLGCVEKMSVTEVFDKWAAAKKLPQVAIDMGRKYLEC